jgi:hypothetical protein
MSTRLLYPVRIVGCLAVVSAAVGCDGNVKTTVLNPDSVVKGSVFEGVLVYPPQYVKTTYLFTTLVNAAGEQIGMAPGGCRETIHKEEITIMPDYGTPMLVSNDAGVASSAKFSATLNNGMLVSVNSEPTEKVSEVLTASKELMTAAAAVMIAPAPPGPTRPACNAGPKVSGFSRITLSAAQ